MRTFILLLFTLTSFLTYSQEINYSYFSASSNDLKKHLQDNDNYFSLGNNNQPTFQSKFKEIYINFQNNIGVNVTYNIKEEREFIKIAKEIKNNAKFNFKFCADYNSGITYNYESNSGNKIRLNYFSKRISVEYPSKVGSLLNRNSGLTTVFVCLSKGSYAFHTNIKCEGLNNCEAKIAQSNIREAKNYNYRFCEICSDDE